MNMIKLFNKPKIIGICGNANEAKSNLIYWILNELTKDHKPTIYIYGLKVKLANTTDVNSIEELEQIKDGIIIIDEMTNLFDLTNRKIRRQIENTIRLIFHNNNILLLCGLGENFKKFLSAKLNAIIFKKTTIADLINGSTIKNILLSYKGSEMGTSILNLGLSEALLFDGLHYTKLNIPYMKEFDTKKDNVPILVPRSVTKSAEKEGKK